MPLIRFGDKYLHIAEEMVYESSLELPLPDGLCHVVFEVDDLDATRQAALECRGDRDHSAGPRRAPDSAPGTWYFSDRPAAFSSS